MTEEKQSSDMHAKGLCSNFMEMKKESKLNKHKNKPTTLWNVNLEFKFVDLCFEFVF